MQSKNRIMMKAVPLVLIAIYGGLTGLMLNGSLRTCCQASFNTALGILALGPIIAVIAFVGWAASEKLFVRRN